MPLPKPGGKVGSGGKTTGGTTGISGAAIAADALRYKGHPYSYGGWDCSSFVNHVLGNDLKMAIPGYAAGAYHGPPPHGPVVLDWARMGSPVASGSERAGDLAIWAGAGTGGHMGICIGGGRMISALNPSLGTAVTPATQGIGPSGVPLQFRRVSGAAGVVPPGGIPPGGGPGGPGIGGMLQAAAAGLAVAGGMVLLTVGVAALVGTALVAATLWITRKAAASGLRLCHEATARLEFPASPSTKAEPVEKAGRPLCAVSRAADPGRINH